MKKYVVSLPSGCNRNDVYVLVVRVSLSLYFRKEMPASKSSTRAKVPGRTLGKLCILLFNLNSMPVSCPKYFKH